MRALDGLDAFRYTRQHVCYDGEYGGQCYPDKWAHDIKMNYISVMRLAPDAGEWRPCDPLLEDEDMERKRYFAHRMKCNPLYWNISEQLEFCNETAFSEMIKLYKKLKYYDKNPGRQPYVPPC